MRLNKVRQAILVATLTLGAVSTTGCSISFSVGTKGDQTKTEAQETPSGKETEDTHEDLKNKKPIFNNEKPTNTKQTKETEAQTEATKEVKSSKAITEIDCTNVETKVLGKHSFDIPVGYTYVKQEGVDCYAYQSGVVYTVQELTIREGISTEEVIDAVIGLYASKFGDFDYTTEDLENRMTEISFIDTDFDGAKIQPYLFWDDTAPFLLEVTVQDGYDFKTYADITNTIIDSVKVVDGVSGASTNASSGKVKSTKDLVDKSRDTTTTVESNVQADDYFDIPDGFKVLTLNTSKGSEDFIVPNEVNAYSDAFASGHPKNISYDAEIDQYGESIDKVLSSKIGWLKTSTEHIILNEDYESYTNAKACVIEYAPKSDPELIKLYTVCVVKTSSGQYKISSSQVYEEDLNNDADYVDYATQMWALMAH